MRIKKLLTKLLTPLNLLVLIILLAAFILRIYRIGELLDFHYDQGRDAKVIWDLWHNGKLFLIGPVTGLPGVFLGPFYYYLIAPLYLISGGNPTIPSIFLSFLVTLALFVLYKTGELIGDRKLGFLALVIGSFSYLLICSGRWLSNPTPIYLTSILLFYFLVKIVKEKKTKNLWWYIVYLTVGVSFHFESASAFLFVPIVLVFTIWQRGKINMKTFLISGLLLFVTFLPQIIFNIKHDNILVKGVLNELPKTDKNTSPIARILGDRLKLLWEIFYVKIFPRNINLAYIFGTVSLLGILKLLADKKMRNILTLFLIFLGIPFVGYMVYRGNHGFLYDYYLTGYYLVMVLFFSLGIWSVSKLKFGNLVLITFLVLFLSSNIRLTYNRLTLGVFDGGDIFLANQLSAISWIYENSQGEEFNVDVYVPPVIPHSYDYLLLWYGSKLEKNNYQKEKRVKLLYTLMEVDTPEHQDRVDAWLARQKGIGIVKQEEKFGGITVQIRERIKYE